MKKSNSKYTIADKIYSNAICAIEMGLEDYQKSIGDSKRLHSAVRNFYAGLMLLLKSKLASLSSDDNNSLIKCKLIPHLEGNIVVWEGKEDRTVDARQIEERFKSLNILIDWKIIAKLQNYRNNIEHYFDTKNVTAQTVGEYISDCFKIICDFMQTYLQKYPQQEFSYKTMEIFTSIQKTRESNIVKRDIAFDDLIWDSEEEKDLYMSFCCTECGCDILLPETKSNEKSASKIKFFCSNCHKKYSYKDIMLESEIQLANNLIIESDDDIITFPDVAYELR